LDQQAHRNLISGQTEGLASGLLRASLRIPALAYGIAVRVRNHLYTWEILKSTRVDVPVICIGNLTAGGTGKTPLVIWLCQFIRQITTAKCAVLTRGYKTAQAPADEPALLTHHCPDATVVINPDRIAGAQQAIQRHSADIIIMDDGFQHRRLARDLDIITVDATEPFGYGRMLPAGLLREPLCALRRAQAVVLTRSDQIPDHTLQDIEKSILGINPDLVLAHARHAPRSVRLLNKATIPCESLAGRRVFAFCGIGNPQAFFRTLSQLKADLVGSQVFDDHYHCTQADMQSLGDRATQAQAQYLLTTEKNFADIRALGISTELPLGYLEVELQCTKGRDELCGLIERVLASRIPDRVEKG
jgi:tetraacyldisaccharide 4'-kinase